MLRRVFMAFVGCLALTCAALPAASAPSTQSPEEFVLKVSNEILDAIKKDPKLQQGEKKAVEALVDEKMMPAVDFLRMTRMAVGPKCRQCSFGLDPEVASTSSTAEVTSKNCQFA